MRFKLEEHMDGAKSQKQLKNHLNYTVICARKDPDKESNAALLALL